MPSGRFAANGAWLAVQVMAHNLARWTARIGLGERTVTTKTLRRRVFALDGTDHPLGAPPHSASPPALALGIPVHSRLGPAASHSTPGLTARLQLTQRPRKLAPPRSASVPLLRILSPSRASTAPADGHRDPCAATEDRPPTSHLPQWSPGHLPCSSLTPLPLSSRRPSVSFGGFGLNSRSSEASRKISKTVRPTVKTGRTRKGSNSPTRMVGL